MKTQNTTFQLKNLFQNALVLIVLSCLLPATSFAQWSPNTSSTTAPISRSGMVTIGNTSQLGLKLRVQAPISWRFEVAEFKAGNRSLRMVPNTQVNGYNQMTEDGDFLITWTDGQAGALNANAGLVLGPWTAQKTGLRITADGRVSIGTKNTPTSFGSFKLYVQDGILTEEVGIDIGWADYVFQADYDLWTLENVKSYIEAHGHLPNTPSSAEVAAQGGVRIGQSTVNQQEKIEEIFLHLINLNQRIKDLEAENVQLKASLKH